MAMENVMEMAKGLVLALVCVILVILVKHVTNVMKNFTLNLKMILMLNVHVNVI
jgi:hypothetical protein